MSSENHRNSVTNLRSDAASVQSKGCCKCCSICIGKLYNSCKPCMTEYNPIPDNPTRRDRIHYSCLCPPHGPVARILTLLFTLLFVWGTLWGITDSQALPGGNFFGLLVLLVACLLGGEFVKLMRMPPLLGMLIMGCLLRNVPVVNVAKDIDPGWSGALRNIALVVILIRAGLGLDPVALRKLSFGVIRLAFLPCLAETITAAISSHLLLEFPWLWGAMLGFVLAAVSPAVVVPSMLSLTEKGLGVAKGIPTLVIAAASVDDVLAISGFGVVLGITFSTGQLAVTIVKGPLEAVLGLVYGIIFGILLWYIPHRKHSHRTLFRFSLLLFAGLFATFGSRSADVAGAGALGCLSVAFVAALRWRQGDPKNTETEDGEEKANEEEEMIESQLFGYLWLVFQPLLFGLIGAEIDITTIQPKTIGLGIAVLLIGLVIRMIVSFLAVFGTGLNLKERLFIPLAWLPKATVQAAIGSVALDTARAKGAAQDQIDLGVQLVTIAVLVILITAPLGALFISLTAPCLLSSNQSSPDHNLQRHDANNVEEDGAANMLTEEHEEKV